MIKIYIFDIFVNQKNQTYYSLFLNRQIFLNRQEVFNKQL